MLESQLFFGVELDSNLEKLLQKANPYAVKMFLGGDEEYLQEKLCGPRRFLGKSIQGAALPVEQLELLEANIQSLIRNLLADTTLTLKPAVLMATIKNS